MAKINTGFDREKESRSWHFWKFMRPILSILSFNWIRDRIMGRKIMSELGDDPPLIALDKLATVGLVKEEILKVSDLKIYPQILEAARLVCEQDGEVSAEEVEFVENFIRELLPVVVEKAKHEELITFFKTIDASTVNFRNVCHAIKTNLSQKQRQQFLNEIYRLAYLHDLDHNERRLVDDIGQKIGLDATDIRSSAFAARQEREKKLGKPVAIVNYPQRPQITLD